ncbi:MAG: hypothetical protein IK079_03790, partial [Desulfovibrio sp.]|nr:hypothetical protein [Desulfovibrio sp.]
TKGEVRNIYVTFKDRLTRFGFNYLETIFSACGTNIIVIKDEKDKDFVREELVEDMMSVLANFSIELYEMQSKTKDDTAMNRM